MVRIKLAPAARHEPVVTVFCKSQATNAYLTK